jgi:predicted RNase H-like nuclease (RuvC/YqgF family)
MTNLNIRNTLASIATTIALSITPTLAGNITNIEKKLDLTKKDKQNSHLLRKEILTLENKIQAKKKGVMALQRKITVLQRKINAKQKVVTALATQVSEKKHAITAFKKARTLLISRLQVLEQ